MEYTLLGILLIGLIAGAIARLFVSGTGGMGCLMTMGVGVAGSFIGGFLASLLFAGEAVFAPSGLLGSVIGAVVLLLLLRALSRR